MVTVQRLIPVPPEAIFELLADPKRHRDIDGTGMVLDPIGEVEPLALGASFTMSMRSGERAYEMTSTVIAYEDNRKVAWQSRRVGAPDSGGRIWSYTLEPVDGGTLVSETWDVTAEHPASIDRARGFADAARSAMAKTLERIEQIVGG